MGAYFLNINRRQLLLFKSLHRRLIFSRSINFTSRTDSPASETSIVQGNPSLANAQPTPDETPSTTSLSTHWKLHLSVTPTWRNSTLPTPSPQWEFLRKHILLRDKFTCSSCGYLSPCSDGRAMIVDHIDGVASNNDPSNLRVHCPPCDAIRDCGLSGVFKRLNLGESTMAQVEIVRKTREMFESTGVIPRPETIDRLIKPARIDILELANMMMKTPWSNLPERFRRLRGFFTENSSRLFKDTMLIGNLNMRVPNDNSNNALLVKSDRKAARIGALEMGLPRISYSEELHGSDQAFLDSYPPSKTLNTQSAWIYVSSSKFEDKHPDLDALSSAWDKICAKGPSTLSELDKLAERFDVLSGKWLVFVSSDEVDNLWGRILKSTLAGTLGNCARVSTRNKKDHRSSHVIYIYNADYRSIEEVNRVRDGLRELGVKDRIFYKPDIYTHCRIYAGNSSGIPPTRYYSSWNAELGMFN